MGINYYRSPGVHGYIKDNLTGQIEMMNGPRAQAAIHLKGEQFINIARGVFEVESQHDSKAPIYYKYSFHIREHRFGTTLGIQVWNEDPTAEWVEFGTHAGGKTRVLRYRVFGKTADIMEARANL